MTKKLFLISLILGFIFGGIGGYFYVQPEPTFGAPIFNVMRSIIPETTATYYLGTSTPSLVEWNGLFVKDLTISGTCTGCGGGGVGTVTWAINPQNVLAPTTTLSVFHPLLTYASSTIFADGGITSASSTATSTFSGKFGIGTSTPLYNQIFTLGSTTDKALTQAQLSGFFGIATQTPTSLFSVAGTSSLQGLTVGLSGLTINSTKNCEESVVLATNGTGQVICTSNGVTSIAAGTGLSGGTITTTGTLSLNYSALPNDGSKWATSTASSLTIHPTGITNSVGIGTTTVAHYSALMVGMVSSMLTIEASSTGAIPLIILGKSGGTEPLIEIATSSSGYSQFGNVFSISSNGVFSLKSIDSAEFNTYSSITQAQLSNFASNSSGDLSFVATRDLVFDATVESRFTSSLEMTGNIIATSTGTSTLNKLSASFLTGWEGITGPYFIATSTTATSIIFGGLSIQGGLAIPSSASTTLGTPVTGLAFMEANTATSGLILKLSDGSTVPLVNRRQITFNEISASTTIPTTGTTTKKITTFKKGSFKLVKIICETHSMRVPMAFGTTTIRTVRVVDNTTLYGEYILCTNSRINGLSATSTVQQGNANSINDDDGSISNGVYPLGGELLLERGNWSGTADDLIITIIGDEGI